MLAWGNTTMATCRYGCNQPDNCLNHLMSPLGEDRNKHLLENTVVLDHRANKIKILLTVCRHNSVFYY